MVDIYLDSGGYAQTATKSDCPPPKIVEEYVGTVGCIKNNKTKGLLLI
jgi:hypothetical protein